MPPIKANPAFISEMPADELKAKIESLVAALNPIEHMECAALLMATCDLRTRETLALRWADVEPDARAIHIRRSCDDLGGPASVKVARCIAAPRAARDALEQRRAVLGRYLNRYAPELAASEGDDAVPVDDALIICTPEGKPVRPKALSRWWHDKRADYGLFGWTLADLRRARMTLEALEAEAGR